MTDPAAAGEAAARGAAAAVLRAAEGWEFSNYLCGSAAPPEYVGEAEEAFRKSANRTLGTLLGEAWGGARIPEFRRPEMRFVVRFPSLEIELHPVPLFVYGRYRKHSRALAQTPYHCPLCRGRGCRNCGGTGRMVEGSVAEILLPSLIAACGAAGGEDHGLGRAAAAGRLRGGGGPRTGGGRGCWVAAPGADTPPRAPPPAGGAAGGVFQGCGREDADVRMLGSGRPFIAELARPMRRRFDGAAVRAAAAGASGGAADFPVLFPVRREDGQRIPSDHPPKRYRARVVVEGGAAAGDAERLAAGLSGAVLAQRTPVRVTRSRADLVRERRVLEARAALLRDGSLELEVRTEAGAYIKEMISGDGGRTSPSAASILGRPCACAELDVLEVEMADPPEAGQSAT